MFASALVALFAASSFAAAQLTINTPTTPIYYCQPTLLQWSGGVAPYFVTLNRQGNNAVGELLEAIASSTSTLSSTWIVDLPVGTQFIAVIRDSSGATQNSGAVTISANPSGVTTCGSASSQAAAESSIRGALSSTGAVVGASSAVSAVSTSASAATSSAAASVSRAASSVVSSASAAASGVSGSVSGALGSASAAVSSARASASASASRVSGAYKVGASVATVALLAVGSVAVFVL